jgi:hypothetical protein
MVNHSKNNMWNAFGIRLRQFIIQMVSFERWMCSSLDLTPDAISRHEQLSKARVFEEWVIYVW